MCLLKYTSCWKQSHSKAVFGSKEKLVGIVAFCLPKTFQFLYNFYMFLSYTDLPRIKGGILEQLSLYFQIILTTFSMTEKMRMQHDPDMCLEKVGKVKMLTIVKPMIDRGFKLSSLFFSVFTRTLMLMHI